MFKTNTCIQQLYSFCFLSSSGSTRPHLCLTILPLADRWVPPMHPSQGVPGPSQAPEFVIPNEMKVGEELDTTLWHHNGSHKAVNHGPRAEFLQLIFSFPLPQGRPFNPAHFLWRKIEAYRGNALVHLLVLFSSSRTQEPLDDQV